MGAAKSTLRALLIFGGFCLGGFIGLKIYLGATKVDAGTISAVEGELRLRKLTPGFHEDVRLSDKFRRHAVRGVVDMMIQPDGKMAFLLKTSEGWKGNYEGFLYVDSGYPVAPELLVPRPSDEHGRFGIIFKTGRNDFFVREKLTEEVFEVFFDLN